MTNMLGNKLRQILKNRNITQTQISNITNIPRSTIARWINNYSEPTLDDLKKIAHALNVSINYFVDEIDHSNLDLIADIVKIPILGEIPAGMPLEAIEEITDSVYVPKRLVRNKKIFGLEVKGDSMAPGIQDGDYVIISKESCCEHKDVVAFRFNSSGHVTLKRFIKSDSQVILKPDNPHYDPIIINEEIEIIGKVIFLFRKKF